MNKIPIDFKKLKKICLANEETLIPFESNYYFKDNGSKILAVAHCDYVCVGKPDYITYKYKDDIFVQSETLDDRLGVYIITELLPSLGIVTDILLTTNEEIGASTASLFESDKQYNWIFSFDRRGNDIVAYDFEDELLRAQVLEGTGVRLGYGTFSDIVELEHLHAKGLNFGTGYWGEHTRTCYATEKSITLGVSRFIRWHKLYKDVHLHHTPYLYKKGHKAYNYYDDYPTGENYYSDRFSYVKEGNWRNITEEEEEEAESKYKTDHCQYCGEWKGLTYSDKWAAWVCTKCITELEEGEDTFKKEICQYCGIKADEAGTWGDSIDYFTLPDKRVVKICSTCADFLEEELENPQFFESLTFDY